MATLMPGALTVDLVDGSIAGDLDHCPREDLLESARTLLTLLPRVRHNGLWGLGKAYDADCYLHTTDKGYKAPAGIVLSASGPLRPDGSRSTSPPFRLSVFHHSREEFWRYHTYEKPVGTVRDGRVSEDIHGVTSHYNERRWDPAPPKPSQARLPL